MLPPNLGGRSAPVPVERARAELDARRASEACSEDEARASASSACSEDEARASASSACSEDAIVDFDALAPAKQSEAPLEAGLRLPLPLPLPAEVEVMA
jgi:hypothetical protein